MWSSKDEREFQSEHHGPLRRAELVRCLMNSLILQTNTCWVHSSCVVQKRVITEFREYCAVIEGLCREFVARKDGCKCGETAVHGSLSVKGYCQMSRDALRCSTEWMVLYDRK